MVDGPNPLIFDENIEMFDDFILVFSQRIGDIREGYRPSSDHGQYSFLQVFLRMKLLFIGEIGDDLALFTQGFLDFYQIVLR